MHILAISPGQGFAKGFDESRWRAMLHSGINSLMIREKQMDAAPMLALARWCRQEAPRVELWVNGRADVALAAHCGLHAPENYPFGALSLPVSRPLHDPAQFPERAQAQQLILSPVFDTPGKGPALGAEGLNRWLDALPPFSGRILALGGIDDSNAASLIHPRLSGVAMIRSLWDASSPAKAVEALRKSWS